tara:strand:+ start:2408 stop:2656 length:249 start_codon:yes stop_codon:yes gene_type:complete
MRKQRIDGVDSERDVDWEEVEGFRISALLLIDEYQGAMRWADLTTEQQNELIAFRRALLDKHLHSSANDWADAIESAMPFWV